MPHNLESARRSVLEAQEGNEQRRLTTAWKVAGSKTLLQRQEGRPTLSGPGRQHESIAQEAEGEGMTTAKRKRSGTRDPRGGLTAAGRAAFRRKQGSHLKPGVKNAAANMSAEEMRRKGSWAVRFYGRSGKLPPLATLGGSSRRRNTSECFKRCSWEATRYLFAGQPQSIIDDSRTILAQAILNAAQSGRAETNVLRHEGIRALTVAYPRIAI